MKGFVLYELHTALNLHFNNKNNYDFFLYHGKTRVNEDTLKKSPFRWQYAGVESKLEHVLWFMYNAYKENEWAYIPPKSLFFKVRNWIKNNKFQHPDDYLKVIVQNDLIWLRQQYQGSTKLFEVNHLYPNLYEDYKNSCITLETVLLIDTHIKSLFTEDTSRDIVSWPLIIKQMEKIQPFVEQLFDRSSFEELFSKVYLSSEDK